MRVILDAHLEMSRNTAAYDYLKAHKVQVTWAPSATTYHQKTVTRSSTSTPRRSWPTPGRAGEQMFVGSENFSASSLRKNRELGIRTTNNPVIEAVAAVLGDDYAGATPYLTAALAIR